ncbi:MAG: SCO family protein [Hydrogenothermaceae bacterium]|nr:SCO family protein [Hydrogenothermaceae bacterium]
MKRIVLMLILPFFIFSGSFALQGSTKGFPKPVVEVENLVNEEGKPTKLGDFKGKVVILYFGFTNCMHVCPTLTAALKQVSEKLNEKGYKGKYQIVFITVDPKDSPEVLKEYKTTRNLDDFAFLTGNPKDLKKVWDAYGIEVKEKIMEMDHGGHKMKHKMITHTPVRTIIIDKDGKQIEEWLGIYLPVEKIVEDVEELIKK